MVDFENMAFRRPRIDETLLFLLGLFSTMQILQFAGFPFSTWLTVLTVGYLFLTRGFSFRRDWLLLATLVSMIVTMGVSLVSDIPAAYKKVAVTGLLQWILIFLLCFFLRREETDCSVSVFLRGFDWSCRIQLVWCVLQMVAYYGLNLDINTRLFGDLLHMNNETSQYRDGVLACTGLHWHAANLIPILLYAYFRHRNVFVKLLCLVVVYLTKNATTLIAFAAALGLDFLSFSKRTLSDNRCAISRKVMIYAVFGVFGLLLVSPILLPKVWEMAEYLFLRIYQIWNPSYGNESSTVHFNYYKNLPHILRNIPIQQMLFGSGLNTSGYRFTQFFGQYAESVWTVESDFVNGILNKGLIGIILQYWFLFTLCHRLRKTGQAKLAKFVLVLIISGFIYDNQFIWVLLLEYLLYCRTYQSPKECVPYESTTDFRNRPGL